jgi:hypothetical protein
MVAGANDRAKSAADPVAQLSLDRQQIANCGQPDAPWGTRQRVEVALKVEEAAIGSSASCPAPGGRIDGVAALFGIVMWRGSEPSDASEP